MREPVPSNHCEILVRVIELIVKLMLEILCLLLLQFSVTIAVNFFSPNRKLQAVKPPPILNNFDYRGYNGFIAVFDFFSQ